MPTKVKIISALRALANNAKLFHVPKYNVLNYNFNAGTFGFIALYLMNNWRHANLLCWQAPCFGEDIILLREEFVHSVHVPRQ